MTQSTESSKIWLTAEAHQKLQAELENLKGPVRHEIVARISDARDEGDLKENGGYHAAKWAGFEGVTLAAVHDSHLDQARVLAERHGAAAVEDAEAFFDAVDLISIASPAHTHAAPRSGKCICFINAEITWNDWSNPSSGRIQYSGR